MPADERTSLGADGFSQQTHPRFQGSASPLTDIASEAGTDDIFPRIRAATAAWHDVVKAETLYGESSRAILAAMFIPQENVLAVEFDRVPWNAVVFQQSNDTWDFDLEAHRLNPVLVGLTQSELKFDLGVFFPRLKVEIGKMAIFDLNHFC